MLCAQREHHVALVVCQGLAEARVRLALLVDFARSDVAVVVRQLVLARALTGCRQVQYVALQCHGLFHADPLALHVAIVDDPDLFQTGQLALLRVLPVHLRVCRGGGGGGEAGV